MHHNARTNERCVVVLIGHHSHPSCRRSAARRLRARGGSLTGFASAMAEPRGAMDKAQQTHKELRAMPAMPLEDGVGGQGTPAFSPGASANLRPIPETQGEARAVRGPQERLDGGRRTIAAPSGFTRACARGREPRPSQRGANEAPQHMPYRILR
ncbi:hypothetical protein C8Q79DRAFT_450047 [Trametes meyenii]|nr:hypothetical protein C8Q79DRAFT_450047 [Trametes meyenii]